MPGEKLFLSYNSRDREAVDRVRQLLELRRVDTFFDGRDLTPGLPWFDELEAALAQAVGMAVFFGKSGLGLVQKRELQIALTRQVEEERQHRSFPVIPVMLPGSRPEDLPAFSALNTWIDLRGEATVADLEFERLILSLKRDPALVSPARSPVRPSICPYRALEFFREEDSLLYFGRETESQEVLDKVLSSSWVTVLGASGSGKSSLVQAGLFPLLRRQKPPADIWEVIVMQPQKEPFYEVAIQLATLWLEPDATPADRVAEARKITSFLIAKEAKLEDYLKQAFGVLRSTGTTRLLLVIDQFEQLFTHGLTREARGHFVNALLEASAGRGSLLKILITVRADFLSQTLELGTDFVNRLNEGIFALGSMDTGNLRKTIEGPAQRVDLRLEPGLTDSILNELGREPGELALLEFAMSELWNLRSSSEVGGEELTNAALSAIGRVYGAITARADSLMPTESSKVETLERALLRLVHVAPAGGEAGADARQVVKKSEFSAEELDLLNLLVEARLLVAGTEGNLPVIQVAHETLIRHWTWFSERIGAKRQFLLWRQNFLFLLETWRRNKTESTLLSPHLQQEAESMLKLHRADLNLFEREFIEAGVARRHEASLRSKSAFGLVAVVIFFILAYLFWLRSTYHVIPETISRAQNLIKSDSADQNWFEALALVDRSAAWMQAKQISDRGDGAIAIAGILAATDRQTPDKSLTDLLEQVSSEIPSNYPNTWKLSVLSNRAVSKPTVDICSLLQKEAIGSPDRSKFLLKNESYRATSMREALMTCSLYRELKDLSTFEGGTFHRLQACIKLHDEACISDVLSQFREDPRSSFNHELPQFYGWISVDARTSDAFKNFAQTSILGKALIKPPRRSKNNSKPEDFEAFLAYQATGFQVDLSSLTQTDSLLRVKLFGDFQESLGSCTSNETFSREFIDLSVQLGDDATRALADCIASCGSHCPVLSGISKSRVLLIRVSRDLRRRGNYPRAKELAWMALSPDIETVNFRDLVLDESTIPQIEELLPAGADLQPGDDDVVISRLQREGLSLSWSRQVEREILRWNLKTHPVGIDHDFALEAVQRVKPYSDSIVVVIDAAFSWLPVEEEFAFKLARIAELQIEQLPVSDRSRAYCELSAFYSRTHNYSKALALSARSTSRAQQFHAYTQLLREYAIAEGLANPDWWPSRPKLTRFDY